MSTSRKKKTCKEIAEKKCKQIAEKKCKESLPKRPVGRPPKKATAKVYKPLKKETTKKSPREKAIVRPSRPTLALARDSKGVSKKATLSPIKLSPIKVIDVTTAELLRILQKEKYLKPITSPIKKSISEHAREKAELKKKSPQKSKYLKPMTLAKKKELREYALAKSGLIAAAKKSPTKKSPLKITSPKRILISEEKKPIKKSPLKIISPKRMTGMKVYILNEDTGKSVNINITEDSTYRHVYNALPSTWGSGNLYAPDENNEFTIPVNPIALTYDVPLLFKAKRRGWFF